MSLIFSSFYSARRALQNARLGFQIRPWERSRFSRFVFDTRFLGGSLTLLI